MPPDLDTLRQQLRVQFPDAHRSKDPPPALLSHSGLPAFPRGALSELSPATPTASLSLLLAQLLQESEIGLPAVALAKEGGQRSETITSPSTRHTPAPPATDHCPLTTGLIDAADSFDPASYGPGACARLLWIRCQDPAQSLPCADLLLRDGNLPLLVLDLQFLSLRELRSKMFPPSCWYRLRNLAEQSGTALLVFTPQLLLPCAALQLTLTNSFALEDLDRERKDLSLFTQQISHAMTASS